MWRASLLLGPQVNMVLVTKPPLTNNGNPKATTTAKNKQESKPGKKQWKVSTSLTAISREPWLAAARVVVHTVYTRSTVLTCVVDAVSNFLKIIKKKKNVSILQKEIIFNLSIFIYFLLASIISKKK